MTRWGWVAPEQSPFAWRYATHRVNAPRQGSQTATQRGVRDQSEEVDVEAADLALPLDFPDGGEAGFVSAAGVDAPLDSVLLVSEEVEVPPELAFFAYPSEYQPPPLRWKLLAEISRCTFFRHFGQRVSGASWMLCECSKQPQCGHSYS